jgi:hypothetical protein
MTEKELNAAPRIKKSQPATVFMAQRDVKLVDAYRALREATAWWNKHAYRFHTKRPNWVDEANRLGVL